MSLKAAERCARAALAAIRDELEDMMRAEVLRIAGRHPHHTVMGLSTREKFCISLTPQGKTEGRQINAGVLKAFERVQKQYGWDAIPHPRAFIGNGDTVVMTDSVSIIEVDNLDDAKEIEEAWRLKAALEYDFDEETAQAIEESVGCNNE